MTSGNVQNERSQNGSECGDDFGEDSTDPWGISFWADRPLPSKLVYFNKLDDDVVTHYMDDYKYGLRFRMCMRELKKTANLVLLHPYKPTRFLATWSFRH